MRAGDADRVVGAIARGFITFACRAHIGADAAEEQQIGLRLEDRAHHLGRRRLRFVQPDHHLRLRQQRDLLCAAREYAAALGDQLLVVILPTRSRQCEHARTLREAFFGIGTGIDEDVAVVERRHELDGVLPQHAVAEHVARHVADAHDCKRCPRNIGVEFAEMPLDRFPSTPRGDAHFLVVVTGRSARREGIAQPEPMLARNRIGNVGESCGAFVGGNHEIGIVVVMPHDIDRSDHAFGADVVGYVQKRRDENLVRRNALGRDRLARPARGQMLRHKAAFRTNRHDHRVLDLLRFDKPKDFRAEILRPVGPADAAACDFAEAQMYAFHTRRIDENLIQRTRQRHAIELAAIEFDDDGGLCLSVVVDLIKIGADRRLHCIDEAPQNSVLVQALDFLQSGFDLRQRRGFALRALLHRDFEPRIEPQMEQRHDPARDRGMLAQRRPHVVLRERHADLPQETRHRADQRHIAPH